MLHASESDARTHRTSKALRAKISVAVECALLGASVQQDDQDSAETADATATIILVRARRNRCGPDCRHASKLSR
jgi:hypothetical protein